MTIRQLPYSFCSQIYILQTCYTHKRRIGSFWITKDVFSIFMVPKTGWSLYAREIFQLNCPCTLVLENTPPLPWKKYSEPSFLLFLQSAPRERKQNKTLYLLPFLTSSPFTFSPTWMPIKGTGSKSLGSPSREFCVSQCTVYLLGEMTITMNSLLHWSEQVVTRWLPHI